MMKDVSVRDLITGLREQCAKNLKQTLGQRMFGFKGGQYSEPVSAERLYRSDGSYMENRVRKIPLPSDPELLRRAAVGGNECDCCKKSLADLNVPRLEACAKCKMAYYCSKECQVTAWKQGHKKACRAPESRMAGDVMRLQGLQSKPELNLHLVQLVEELDNGRWQVVLCSAEGEKMMSVASGNLLHIRPAK
jgi:hypothetical protein